VKATLHWVSEEHAVDAEVRVFDRLFAKPYPAEDEDFTANVNPDSLTVLSGCKVEPGLEAAAAGTRYQFERLGYFCVDPDSRPGRPVFNRTVTLKDPWARMQKAKQDG
jgi:glutaminyl-tRNA synthetase